MAHLSLRGIISTGIPIKMMTDATFAMNQDITLINAQEKGIKDSNWRRIQVNNMLNNRKMQFITPPLNILSLNIFSQGRFKKFVQLWRQLMRASREESMRGFRLGC